MYQIQPLKYHQPGSGFLLSVFNAEVRADHSSWRALVTTRPGLGREYSYIVSNI